MGDQKNDLNKRIGYVFLKKIILKNQPIPNNSPELVFFLYIFFQIIPVNIPVHP